MFKFGFILKIRSYESGLIYNFFCTFATEKLQVENLGKE